MKCEMCEGKGYYIIPAYQKGDQIEDEREVECPHVTLEKKRQKEQDDADGYDQDR